MRTRLFGGKMHSDWFNGKEILQGRWQHGEKVGYCHPSRLEKALCKWGVYIPLVTKGLKKRFLFSHSGHFVNIHTESVETYSILTAHSNRQGNTFIQMKTSLRQLNQSY
jgi:hypothetical protein